MPDCAIFADTGAEPAATYEHLAGCGSPNVLPFPVHVVRAGNLRDDILGSAIGAGPKNTRPPWFIRKTPTARSILRRQCTQEYKILPIQKTCASCSDFAHASMAEGSRRRAVDRDQPRRGESDEADWTPAIANRWPLIELRMSGATASRGSTRTATPRPPKSACTFCPFRRDAEWRRMRDEAPEEFADACAGRSRHPSAGTLPAPRRGLRPPVAGALDEVDLSTHAERGQTRPLPERGARGCAAYDPSLPLRLLRDRRGLSRLGAARLVSRAPLRDRAVPARGPAPALRRRGCAPYTRRQRPRPLGRLLGPADARSAPPRDRPGDDRRPRRRHALPGLLHRGLRGSSTIIGAQPRLAFLRLAHAINAVRLRAGRPGLIVVGERPRGLLRPGNAFGCFLGALVGADAPLCSPLERGRWPRVGWLPGHGHGGMAGSRRSTFPTRPTARARVPCRRSWRRGRSRRGTSWSPRPARGSCAGPEKRRKTLRSLTASAGGVSGKDGSPDASSPEP